jgi:hypothetical protein
VETLTIKQCPMCTKGNHTYSLLVERTFVMKMITAFSMTEEASPQPRTFTRIFVCPETGKKFQASFTLLETPDDKIKSVTVEGSENEEHKEQ